MNFCVSPNAGLPKPDLVLFANWNKVGFEQKRAHIQQLLADTTMEVKARLCGDLLTFCRFLKTLRTLKLSRRDLRL